MKKITKVLSIILATAMLLSCISAPAFAATKKTEETKDEGSKIKTIDEYPNEALVLDANDKKELEKYGLKADTKNTNENKYSGIWKLSERKQLWLSKIKDINGFGKLEFYLYGDEKYPITIMVVIQANNPDTDGSDYYSEESFQVKPGWNKYEFDLTQMVNKKSRTPKTMNEIDAIIIYADGWDMTAKNKKYIDEGYINVDSVKLIKGDSILTTPVVREPETEAGTAKYFEYTFEEEDTKAATKGMGLYTKSNKNEIKKEKDNKYLLLSGLGTNDDGHIDISVKYARRYMIIQGDFKIESFDTTLSFATARDSAGNQNSFVYTDANGKLTANGKRFAELETGKWFNLAICADFANRIYTVYYNGEAVAEDVPFSASNMGYMTLYRIRISPGTSKLGIDNLRVYDGRTPDDYEKAVDTPRPAYQNANGGIDIETIKDTPAFVQVKSNSVSAVKDAVCLKVNSPFALVRHVQTPIDANNKEVAPFVINGRTLVPVRFIAEAFGAEVGWDAGTRTVTVKKDSDLLTLAIGSNVINKNGTDITIDVPAEIYNERTMLPLRAVTENLGKKVFWDDCGLIIISDDEIKFTKENDLNKMLDIMAGFTYERPSIEKLEEDILKTAPNHPRLLATADDFNRIKELMKTDENMKDWVAYIIKVADRYVKEAPTEAEHVYKGGSDGRLANNYNIHDKATSMGMAYQLTGDKKYIDGIWYTLKDMCAWEHWHPGHFLNAADVMLGVAIAYDWMYDGWSDEQRTIIEEALYNCGIEDSVTSYHGAADYLAPPMDISHRSGWFKVGSNWNAHCNAGVMGAGIAMATHEKYGKYALMCINYSMNSIEVGLRCYAPDGGYEEGVGYWSYGTNSAVMLMEALNKAAGSNYGLSDAPGFSSTYATGLYMESKQGSFNYSDANVTRSDTSFLFWWGKEYNNPQVNGVRLGELLSGEKVPTYSDLIFYDPNNIDTNSQLQLDYKFYETDTFTMRSSWTDENQLFGGIHGGSNTANHCNLDSGVFILDSLNTRWFIDLGSDSYSLPSYWSTGAGGKRWNYYSQRAEGHNCFVINPGLKEDQIVNSVSKVTGFVSKPRGAYGKVDLTPAYEEDVTKATRGMMFTANRKAAIVQDEITMKAPSEFWWFAHTKADIKVSEDGRSAVLTIGTKKLHAAIVSDDENLKFTVMDAVLLPSSPPLTEAVAKIEKSRADVKKLAIHARSVSNVNLAVVFQPMLGSAPEYEYTYTALDNWQIPDGEIYVPTLTDIKVAGNSIESFSPTVTGYRVVLPFDAVQVPEVVATPDASSEYQVMLPPELPGNAIIKVTNKEDPTMYTVYDVFLRPAADTEIKVSAAQDGNPGENCLDKDLLTRWAVEGESWGIFTFARAKTISSVWIATWKAAERKLKFDIEVSEDGENFNRVWSGQSTTNKDELEEFKIPEGTYKAVKLVLHGTTAGAWNSLLEVEFK